jgi:pilus assembly protein CpaB
MLPIVFGRIRVDVPIFVNCPLVLDPLVDVEVEPQNATVVALLVPLEDAEKLALATQEAHIQLVLRNPLDTKREKPATVGKTTLFGVLPKYPLRLVRTKHAPSEPEREIDIELLRGTQKETIHFKQ